jgi:hypothetical protein
MATRRKKQSKKKISKKRKSTPKKGSISTTSKNKNIIRISLSGQGSGSSGSSVIPIPYASNISSTMNPLSQPVNIYNTLGRNPYEPNYETLKVNQATQTEPSFETFGSFDFEPIRPEPQTLNMPIQSSIYETMYPVNRPKDISNSMTTATQTETETQPKKETATFETQTEPTLLQDSSTQTKKQMAFFRNVRPILETNATQTEYQPFLKEPQEKFTQTPPLGIGLTEELKKKKEAIRLRNQLTQQKAEPEKPFDIPKPVSRMISEASTIVPNTLNTKTTSIGSEGEETISIIRPIKKKPKRVAAPIEAREYFKMAERNQLVKSREESIRSALEADGRSKASISQIIRGMKQRGEL